MLSIRFCPLLCASSLQSFFSWGGGVTFLHADGKFVYEHDVMNIFSQTHIKTAGEEEES